jgi:hypothetical protein
MTVCIEPQTSTKAGLPGYLILCRTLYEFDQPPVGFTLLLKHLRER